MVLIQSWPPHLALAPIAQADPPLMPFRDAGYSQADFVLNVQDVVYGVWKAKEEGLCGLKDFSLEEYVTHFSVPGSVTHNIRYETYERVDMGDFNWITPDFLAFASPQHKPTAPIAPTSPLFQMLPKNLKQLQSCDLPTPFINVLSHFTTRNIGLVVRLNSELYSPSYFTALGISHLDMIFDDGTCPPMNLVRKFIKLAHDMITNRHKGIAVHCKAGLGRTGCLIGAYLIYRHGFTANEIIAFMRFMRPGMVVGPQQHWLHLHQMTFREWRFEDARRERAASTNPTTPSRAKPRMVSNSQVATPPNGSQGKRSALGEIDKNDGSITTAVMDENLPAPTPGQPRKTSVRHHPYSRAASASLGIENKESPETQIVSRRTNQGMSDSEEEWQLKMLSRRTSSRSPANDKGRSVSYTTTTTTVKEVYGPLDESKDIHIAEDDWEAPQTVGKPSHASITKSGSGSGSIGVNKIRGSPRRSADSRSESKGIRKTSGRVGSTSGPRMKS